MGTVTVPADFFRQELRIYGNWREALARELLQNAIDARPSRIDITCETVTAPDGTTHGRVTFTDDGCGMDRDTLENVFFALGRTTKSGPDSIGGFGRARIIICFAQRSYTIETGDLRVTGHGGEYQIEQATRSLQGARFTIDLVDDFGDRIAEAFTTLLHRSNLTIPVTVNGEPVRAQPMPPRARVLRDENGQPWARAYVRANGFGRVDVRVHGLPMFSRWISTQDSVVVELIPARSREVLLASRDALNETYANLLTQFETALSQNRRNALRPPAEPLNLVVGGGGFLVSAAAGDAAGANDAGVRVSDGTDEEQQAAFSPSVQPDAVAEAGTGQFVLFSPGNEAALERAAHAGPAMLTAEQYAARASALAAMRSSLGFDVHLMADRGDAKVRRAARAWDPSEWGATSGKRRRALVLAWKRAAGYAIDVLLAQQPSLDRVAWTVGLTFDEDVEAVCRETAGGFVLALNPVTSTGAIRYQVSTRASRQKLLALALHEAAHVVHRGHDERFASLLTDMVAAIDPAEADRRIRL